jgi:hypothetical protein
MVSKDEYKKAKKIVEDYEQQEREDLAKKIALMEVDLKDFFAKNKVGGRTIRKFTIDSILGQKDIVRIIPVEPDFNEDYQDDSADTKIMEIGNKYGVWLKFHSGVYPK